LLLRGQHLGERCALPTSRCASRNAEPLGCARIPRYSESLRSQVRRVPSVLARTSSRPLSIADEGKGSDRASGWIRPDSIAVRPLWIAAHPRVTRRSTSSRRVSGSDPRRPPLRKPTAPAWAGKLLGPGRSL